MGRFFNTTDRESGEKSNKPVMKTYEFSKMTTKKKKASTSKRSENVNPSSVKSDTRKGSKINSKEARGILKQRDSMNRKKTKFVTFQNKCPIKTIYGFNSVSSSAESSTSESTNVSWLAKTRTNQPTNGGPKLNNTIHTYTRIPQRKLPPKIDINQVPRSFEKPPSYDSSDDDFMKQCENELHRNFKKAVQLDFMALSDFESTDEDRKGRREKGKWSTKRELQSPLNTRKMCKKKKKETVASRYRLPFADQTVLNQFTEIPSEGTKKRMCKLYCSKSSTEMMVNKVSTRNDNQTKTNRIIPTAAQDNISTRVQPARKEPSICRINMDKAAQQFQNRSRVTRSSQSNDSNNDVRVTTPPASEAIRGKKSSDKVINDVPVTASVHQDVNKGSSPKRTKSSHVTEDHQARVNVCGEVSDTDDDVGMQELSLQMTDFPVVPETQTSPTVGRENEDPMNCDGFGEFSPTAKLNNPTREVGFSNPRASNVRKEDAASTKASVVSKWERLSAKRQVQEDKRQHPNKGEDVNSKTMANTSQTEAQADVTITSQSTEPYIATPITVRDSSILMLSQPDLSVGQPVNVKNTSLINDSHDKHCLQPGVLTTHPEDQPMPENTLCLDDTVQYQPLAKEIPILQFQANRNETVGMNTPSETEEADGLTESDNGYENCEPQVESCNGIEMDQDADKDGHCDSSSVTQTSEEATSAAIISDMDGGSPIEASSNTHSENSPSIALQGENTTSSLPYKNIFDETLDSKEDITLSSGALPSPNVESFQNKRDEMLTASFKHSDSPRSGLHLVDDIIAKMRGCISNKPNNTEVKDIQRHAFQGQESRKGTSDSRQQNMKISEHPPVHQLRHNQLKPVHDWEQLSIKSDVSEESRSTWDSHILYCDQRGRNDDQCRDRNKLADTIQHYHPEDEPSILESSYSSLDEEDDDNEVVMPRRVHQNHWDDANSPSNREEKDDVVFLGSSVLLQTIIDNMRRITGLKTENKMDESCHTVVPLSPTLDVVDELSLEETPGNNIIVGHQEASNIKSVTKSASDCTMLQSTSRSQKNKSVGDIIAEMLNAAKKPIIHQVQTNENSVSEISFDSTVSEISLIVNPCPQTPVMGKLNLDKTTPSIGNLHNEEPQSRNRILSSDFNFKDRLLKAQQSTPNAAESSDGLLCDLFGCPATPASCTSSLRFIGKVRKKTPCTESRPDVDFDF